MYRHDPGGHREVREQLVSYSIRLLDDGLAVGSAGNMSARVADEILITPSGIPRLACSRGEPRILTEAELQEVAAEVRRRRYGQAQ